MYSKFQPIEQSRWNEANIDTLYYAGNQTLINRNLNFSAGITSDQYYFNLVQQPVNMLTGRQRQRRKSITYQASDGSDPHTTDQYTRLIKECVRKEGINEAFSKSCELSAVAGLNLMQPYLDFTGDDPAQGSLKVKVWEYNSFLVDPFFRQPDMSDAQFVWTQEYISKHEAESRFPDMKQYVAPMAGTPQRYGNFYFLPENYNMARNDLMVLSYVWYKWKKKRKRLYSKSRNQFFDFAKGANIDPVLQSIRDLEVVNVDSPCWKVAVVLNEQLMYIGENPLWDGPECPFIPTFWNYDPHISQYQLRSRSLVFPMRSPQFLFNHKVITNNDIAASSINSGWKRKVGAVANEDNLKKAGQGWDVIINEGYEMMDVEKIIPNAVPQSDLELASQMQELIFATSGIQLENWSGQQDKQISSLTMLLKQDANLMVFQKYFDQWDMSLKLLGERMLQIVLNNWNEFKVSMLINEEPTEHFYSRIFAKYHTIVEEGLETPTQRNLQAQSLLDINSTFGREVFPPSMIVKDMNIQGKAEAVEFLKQQEQQAQQMQQEQQQLAHVIEDAKLKELYSKAMANIARAREDHSRSESNLGLYEERLSMIERNRSLSLKEKQAALTSLLDNISRFGEIQTANKQMELDQDNMDMRYAEELEKQDVEQRTESNKFLMEILQGLNPEQLQGQQSQQMTQPMQGQQQFPQQQVM